jgi:hypothetical protein
MTRVASLNEDRERLLDVLLYKWIPLGLVHSGATAQRRGCWLFGLGGAHTSKDIGWGLLAVPLQSQIAPYLTLCCIRKFALQERPNEWNAQNGRFSFADSGKRCVSQINQPINCRASCVEQSLAPNNVRQRPIWLQEYGVVQRLKVVAGS